MYNSKAYLQRKVHSTLEIVMAGLAIVSILAFFVTVYKYQYRGARRFIQLTGIDAKKSYEDLSHWKKQETLQLPFQFYFPETMRVDKKGESNTYELVDGSNTVGGLILIDFMEYKEYQAVIDDPKIKAATSFGFTNGYGTSVFEYMNESVTPKELTILVVSKEKHQVMRFKTSDELFFPLAKNIVKMTDYIDPKKEQRFVNFTHNYVWKLNPDYRLSTVSFSPFGVENDFLTKEHFENIGLESDGDLKVEVLDKSMNQTVSASQFKALSSAIDTDSNSTVTIDEFTEGHFVSNVNKNEIKGKLYSVSIKNDAEREGVRGYLAALKKDDKVYVLSMYWTSEKERDRNSYLFNDAVNRFRFLSDEEKLNF